MHAGSGRAEDCTGKLQQRLLTPEPELQLCTSLHKIYLDTSAPVMYAGSCGAEVPQKAVAAAADA